MKGKIRIIPREELDNENTKNSNNKIKTVSNNKPVLILTFIDLKNYQQKNI